MCRSSSFWNALCLFNQHAVIVVVVGVALLQVDDAVLHGGSSWCAAASNGGTSCSNRTDSALLAALVEEHVQLDALLEVAARAQVPLPPQLLPRMPRSFRAAVGVAKDAAFCKYYQQ